MGDLKSQQHNQDKGTSGKTYAKWKKHNNLLPYLTALLDDFFNTIPQYALADYAKDLDVLRHRYENEGASFATITIQSLSKGLLMYLETGKATYTGFKLQANAEYPRFLRGLFRLVYGECCADKDLAIRAIYQFGSIFKKLRGPYSNAVLAKQLQDFVNTDQQLPSDFSAEYLKPIVDHARSTITSIFKRFDPLCARNLPRPGPGATNTPVEKQLRYRPHVMYKQLNDVFDYQEWFYSHPWDVVEQSKVYLKMVASTVERPTSRFKFVDKQVGKARGICIEENEMQWLQQGLKAALYDWIETHPLTKGKINFASQEVNANLAMSSSITRTLATIDMSEASDRVSRSLVNELFSGVPELRDMLIALSTRVITLPRKINGTRSLEAKKYAPMGSGLCFPVMSVVHFALVRAIISLSMQNSMENRDSVYVYGDDILLPTSCTESVYDWLPVFGMKLNVEKSYYRGHFRESCGIHAYKGNNITPVYFKYIPHQHAKVPALLSAIENEQFCREAGWHSIAALIRRNVTLMTGKLPTVYQDSPALGWKSKDLLNTDPLSGGPVKSRWNWDTHEWEYRMRLVVPQQADNPPLVENEAYLRRLVTNTRAFSSRHSRDGCERLNIVHGWISSSGLCGINRFLPRQVTPPWYEYNPS